MRNEAKWLPKSENLLREWRFYFFLSYFSNLDTPLSYKKTSSILEHPMDTNETKRMTKTKR